jgi:hypothetical protein
MRFRKALLAAFGTSWDKAKGQPFAQLFSANREIFSILV